MQNTRGWFLVVAVVGVPAVVGASAPRLTRRARRAVLFGAVVALLALIGTGCGAAQGSPGEGRGADIDASPAAVETQLHVHPAAPSIDTPTSQPIGLATPGPYSTAIEDSAFEFHIAVIAGSTVTWTNTDEMPHTVTADDGSFDSGPLQPGQAFTAAFVEAGVWNYGCVIHPQMRGLVHVEGAPPIEE